jgi:hypothetical protein
VSGRLGMTHRRSRRRGDACRFARGRASAAEVDARQKGRANYRQEGDEDDLQPQASRSVGPPTSRLVAHPRPFSERSPGASSRMASPSPCWKGSRSVVSPNISAPARPPRGSLRRSALELERRAQPSPATASASRRLGWPLTDDELGRVIRRFPRGYTDGDGEPRNPAMPGRPG